MLEEATRVSRTYPHLLQVVNYEALVALGATVLGQLSPRVSYNTTTARVVYLLSDVCHLWIMIGWLLRTDLADLVEILCG